MRSDGVGLRGLAVLMNFSDFVPFRGLHRQAACNCANDWFGEWLAPHLGDFPYLSVKMGREGCRHLAAACLNPDCRTRVGRTSKSTKVCV